MAVARPGQAFELRLTPAADDSLETRVGFELTETPGNTHVCFPRTCRAEPSAHFRTTAYRWVMYLRVLTRFLAFGEQLPYERRLHV